MRSPILIIATGMQEIGKSYTTLKQAIYQAYLAKYKRSALIFDVNNEYGSYEIDGIMHKIKTLKHNEIIKFGNNQVPEVRRIIPFYANGFPMKPEETEKLLIQIINYYRGGTLIIEDMNRVYGDSLPDTVSGLLCNVRHRNCDVVLHLQSVGRILPKMLQNVKIIRYHFQLDAIRKSESKLAGEEEIYYIAEKLVRKQYYNGNIHFFIYVYRMIGKIKGQFSPKMLTEAIQEYLSENTRVIKPLLEKRNSHGKKMYSYEKAMELKTQELFIQYWDM